MPNGVIDLRGSRTGLEGLGEALSNLLRDPNDRIREFFLANPDIGKQMATNIEASQRRTTPESLAAQGLGKADVEFTEAQLGGFLDEDVLPLEIQKELLQTFAETPEEVRAREVGELTREKLPPEEEAGLVVAERRARAVPSLRLLAENEAVSPQEWGDAFRSSLGADQAEAELRDYEATWGLDYQKALETTGMSPDLMAKRAFDNFLLEGKRLEAQGLEVAITQRDLEQHLAVYDSLSPTHKRLFSLGNMPGSQYVAQALLQGLAYDQQTSMSRMANAKSVEELIMARAADRITLQGAMDEDIVKLSAAVEEKDQGRIEELANRLTAHARDLMSIDPQAGFAQGELLRNIFGKITGIEFAMGDIISSGRLEGWYGTLAAQFDKELKGSGFTHQEANLAVATEKLNEALKDPLTGAVNPKERDFVMLLTAQGDIGAIQEREALMAQQAAQEATMRADPEVMERELQAARVAFNDALTVADITPEQRATGAGLPPNILELYFEVRRLEWRKFFFGGGTRGGAGFGGR